jgi:hypothetical protein
MYCKLLLINILSNFVSMRFSLLTICGSMSSIRQNRRFIAAAAALSAADAAFMGFIWFMAAPCL